MKKRLILSAAAMCALTIASAQVNSADGAGFLLRASEMMSDGNYNGCIDQLTRAVELPLTAEQREAAALLRAQATVHANKDMAAQMLRAFLSEYPATARRGDAMLALADCYSGSEALAIYSQINPKWLAEEKRADLYYRMGCAYLKVDDYAQAEKCFDSVGDNRVYAQAVKFYKGYIAYAKGDYKAALPMLQEAKTAKAPGNMADYYLSQIYYYNEDWKKAYDTAKAAMSMRKSQGGTLPEALRVAGESAYHLGDLKQAKQYLNEYCEAAANPQPSALYILGLFAYEDGNYKRAIEMMRPATALDNGMGQSAYLYIGQALLKENDNDAAILAFDKSLNMGFDREVQETAYYNYAVASLAGGKVPFGNTVGTFETFLRRYPDSRYASEVQKYIIASYFKDRDWAGALASINAMANPTAETNKAKQRILYMLGAQTLADGNANKAIAYLQQAQTLAGCDAEVAREVDLSLGEAYYRAGKYEESAAQLLAYLKAAPQKASNRPIALYDLGYARYGQKKYGDAAADFAKFLSAPGNASASILADANCRLGDCYYYEKRYADASSAYDKAYDLNPSVGDYAIFQKGLMEGYQRHYAEKIELMQQMQKQFPSSGLVPDALLEISEGYIQLGKNADAIAAYKELVEKYPNTAQGRQGYVQMALTMLNAGQRKQAVEAYKMVISKYPTSEEAQVATDQLKRVAADDGTLPDFLAFMKSVPNAPQVDADEVEKLTFESAEKEFITTDMTERLEVYVEQYATDAVAVVNPTNAAKALSYLMEAAEEEGNSDKAYDYACRIVERYPDNSVALAALATKGKIEYAQGKGNLALRTYRQLEEKASTPYMLNQARLGIARCAVEAEEYAQAIEAATNALSSGKLGDGERIEALYLRGKARSVSGKESAARADWEEASSDPSDANSMHSAYALADSYFRAGELDKAESLAKEVANAQTPHIYWMARGFILLADIYSAQGNEYKAQQYLQSLKTNYPGTEADIFEMIEQRLPAE